MNITNKDFRQSVNILFLSNEKIIGKERDFMNELIEAYKFESNKKSSDAGAKTTFF